MKKHLLAVGERIRYIRKSRKISMKELGKLVNLHESTVSRYEKGEITTLDIEKLKEFAKALNVPVDYLAGWDTNKSFENLIIRLSDELEEVILTDNEINAIVDYAVFIVCRNKEINEAIHNV